MFRPVALALLLATSGCSFALVRRPPSTVALGERPPCTTSYLVPVLDGAFAAVTAFALVRAALESAADPAEPESNDDPDLTPLVYAGGISAVLLWGAGGIWGARQVDRCRSIHAASGGSD